MSAPAYPDYKSSGIDWLGDVPSGWRVGRIKDSVALAKNGVWGNEPTGGTDDIWCVRVADFDRPTRTVRNDKNRTVRNVPASERKGRELARGDLLLEKSGGGEKSPVGFVALFDYSDAAVCSNFVARVKLARGMFPAYWAYLHATTYAIRLTQRSIKQTSGIQNLDQWSYFNELVPYPSPREQQQIAEYLDAHTAKIDLLIGKQKRLIETLAERRQAVISHAVTKGLDPTAPMNDSGVSWLGLVPAHWKVIRVKRTTVLITDGAHISPETEDGVYDFVSTRDVSAEGIDFEGALKTSAHSYEYLVNNGCRPAAGDVLFSKDGTVGRTVVVEEDRPFVVASSLIIVRPNRSIIDSYFLNYLFQAASLQEQVRSFVKGAGLPRLSIANLLKIVGVTPPLSEQQKIVGFLDRETAQIDALSAKAREMIDVLKERRQALISAAVTGKIDVRGLS